VDTRKCTQPIHYQRLQKCTCVGRGGNPEKKMPKAASKRSPFNLFSFCQLLEQKELRPERQTEPIPALLRHEISSTFQIWSHPNVVTISVIAQMRYRTSLKPHNLPLPYNRASSTTHTHTPAEQGRISLRSLIHPRQRAST